MKAHGTWMIVGVSALVAAVDAQPMLGADLARQEAPPASQGQPRQPSGRDGGPTDAQILALLEVANLSDIETGQLGQMKSSNSRVQQYGHRMVQEHTAMLNAGAETALHLSVVPEKPPEAKLMMNEHKQQLNELADKTGAEFDRAYLEHEVKMHQRVLQKIDLALQESEHAEVKQLLEKSRKQVETHLKAAQDLKR